MAAISEYLRFALARSTAKASAFQELRKLVAERGLAKIQYFGYAMPTPPWKKPKEDLMCWYIEWPKTSKFRNSPEFKSELVKLAADTPRSLLFEFSEEKHHELIKGLEVSACEFAVVDLVPDAPRFTAEFEYSMDKTYTDCYLAPAGGMGGGAWGYALNTIDAAGEEITTDNETGKILDEDRRMVALWIMGWQSQQLHHAYQGTELYSEEIDKLLPYFGAGAGAFFVNLQKHS